MSAVVAPATDTLRLDNAPGPEADADALKAHYRRVQDVFATNAYDVVIYLCHWCLSDGGDNGLAFTKTEQPRGTRQYCSARCANAYSAYMQKVVVKGRIATPSPSDETEDDSSGATSGAAQPQRTRKRRRGIVDAHYTPVQPGSDEERAVLESATAPLPKGTKIESAGVAGPRKARAKQAAREDGKCARGLHDLTPDNTYTHNGVSWCRACKADNRARYIAKKKGGDFDAGTDRK